MFNGEVSGKARRKRSYGKPETMGDGAAVYGSDVVVVVYCTKIRKWVEVLQCPMMWHGCTEKDCVVGV